MSVLTTEAPVIASWPAFKCFGLIWIDFIRIGRRAFGRRESPRPMSRSNVFKIIEPNNLKIL